MNVILDKEEHQLLNRLLESTRILNSVEIPAALITPREYHNAEKDIRYEYKIDAKTFEFIIDSFDNIMNIKHKNRVVASLIAKLNVLLSWSEKNL